ncbi:MAG: DUF1036 domain-containing protein [Hyphomicrobiaceae bacterium]
MTVRRGIGGISAALLVFMLCIASASAQSRISFHNQSSRVVTLAIMVFKPGCDGSTSNYATRGWWNLNSGDRQTVYVGDHRTFIYFYAYNDLGEEYTTSGPYFACVPARRFDWCQNTCDTAPGTRSVAFREVFIGTGTNVVIPLTRN